MIASAAAPHNAQEFQRLKTSLHHQMVDAIDFSRAESLSEDELRNQLRSLAQYLCNREETQLDGAQRGAIRRISAQFL